MKILILVISLGCNNGKLDSGYIQVPTARLINNAYYSPGFSSVGMSNVAYNISTAGVNDGDLLLFFGSIDCSFTGAWSTLLPYGFNVIVDASFGNDNQNYFIAYKIAHSEVATYSQPYGGGCTGTAVISLLAVKNASQSNPINATWTGNDTGANIIAGNPIFFNSPGVTSTMSNCLLVYVTGVDWAASGSITSSVVPSSYASIVQIADHGDAYNFDWSAMQIAYSYQKNPGPSGSVLGSLTGTPGLAFTGLVAVCE